ncbi:unnamed protein product [Paramecium primaurelia]|uniref:Uncharacterized protein n=1 Tax=Paramecium primaurelia TaxID=5886 RepID=A0A8S1LSZ3_PARPR|nr:unnamed protein product [Paramecium primaurelia]
MVKFEEFQKLTPKEKKKAMAELHDLRGATYQIYKERPLHHIQKKVNPKHNFGIYSVPKYFI